MDLDYRKHDMTRFSDFTEEDEKLITEVYDQLSDSYDISVIDIQDSPYEQFSSHDLYPIFIPKICYSLKDRNKDNPFYLYIVSKVGMASRGGRLGRKYDTVQLWGLKKLEQDFGYISINKKRLMDKIAGIFTSFNINFKDHDFKDFYVLGSDQYKAMNFLNSKRKETIQSFPNENFKLEVRNTILSFGLPEILTTGNAEIISKFLNEI
ncbi:MULTISPECIES: hypothetical protein [Chryseobacterium]|uniref:Uncharacterized protein n=2 Tax=Chryseobacterium TaxID=59732 RepID=A0A543EK12_9FLAO|nr:MULTISPECIES: hypothetical protein [Chryseobacterium]MDR6458368.1 hypothetical protein [Chryseobacterium vietnamense]MDR6486980.1 hypothetical protein [Chryseobacterium vietnamense]TQM21916.1 hypothetical protein FB551_1616 [Chryseobacterium aquifrigidense]